MFRIDWDLLPKALVPRTIRASIERRLAALWDGLDCSAGGGSPRRNAWKSEPFRIGEECWIFTYQIDLRRGAAVVNRLVSGPVARRADPASR